jgi:hypothetical protein
MSLRTTARRPLAAFLAAAMLGSGALAWSSGAGEDELAPVRAGFEVLAPAMQAAGGVLPKLGAVLQMVLAPPTASTELDTLFEDALGSAGSAVGSAATGLLGDPRVDEFDAEAEQLLSF